MTNELSKERIILNAIEDGRKNNAVGDEYIDIDCDTAVVVAALELADKMQRDGLEKPMPEGDDIYSLGQREMGRIEGWNACIKHLKAQEGGV